MCREGGGGQGRGRGPPAAPHHLCVQAQAASTRVLLWRESWGEEGSSPGHGFGQVSLWSPPSPCCWPQASLSLIISIPFVPHSLHGYGVKRTGGLGAPVCAGAVSGACPAMGTRGTHWNVPGKGNLWETSCLRGQGGRGRNTAWAANLTIISAVSSCHLGSGNCGQWQAAAAGSRLRKPSVTRRARPGHT